MEQAVVAITGATGAIGGMVAETLTSAGVPTRLLVRDERRAPRLPGAEVRQFDYAHPEESALAGVSGMLFVSAHEGPERLGQHRAVLEAAAAQGVPHVVYTSYVGAAQDATFTLARDHWATEQMIRELSLPATILRDNMYIDFAEHLVGADGVIRGPAGNGRAAMVTRRDIAEVAAAVLRQPEAHLGRTYDLTGPEALGLAEVADLVGRATGRPTHYHDETEDEAYRSREHYGAPAWEVEAWVSTYLAIRSGELAEVSDAVPSVLGRPATSLAAFLGIS